jgi:hypothetical protein
MSEDAAAQSRVGRLLCGPLVLGALLAPLSQGQSSELYLSTHGNGPGTVYVVQNGAIQRQWSGSDVSGSIVVLDDVRTAGNDGGAGTKFTLTGAFISLFLNPGTTGMHADDSTTDGSHIYTFSYSLQELIRFDLDWSNPVPVFAPDQGPWASVAYDATDNTFWLAGWMNATISHRTATGVLLGSFPVTSAESIALALDPADDTLWLVIWGTGVLEQWSKSGTLLQSISVPGIGGLVAGGEFQVAPGGTPVWTNLGSGLSGINGIPMLAGTGTLVPGDPGTLTLSNAAPSAFALLFISLSSTPVPFKCGVLVPVPWVALPTFTTDGSGGIPLAWSAWPPGLSGQSIYCQYAVEDSAAMCGASLSNALRADVP